MMTSNFNQLNFDNPLFLSNDEYIKVTVAIKITDNLTSLKNSVVRSVRTSIAACLIKLRTGLSSKMISVLFGPQEP